MKLSNLRRFADISEIPEGQYPATWCCRIVSFKAEGVDYSMQAPKGVRGIVEVKVIIENGEAVLQTT